MVISKSLVFLLLLTLFLSSVFTNSLGEDRRRQFEQCKERCQRQSSSPKKQEQCRRTCREQFEEQEGDNKESGEKEQKNNPFFFHSRMFESRFESGEGRFGVLPRFTQQSPLLRRIENYRLSILEVNPNTFVVPHHCDSEAILFVVSGQGTITFVNDERRQPFIIKCGNVVRVPAGVTVYMVNPERKKLTIAALKESVNAPGHYEEFFPTGLQNSQAYYNVFSNEVLEAVFNTPGDQLRRLFEGQEQRQSGMIRRASKEQLKALSKESSSPWEQSEFPSPIQLIDGEPEYSSQNGDFYEIRPDEFKQLHDMGVAVSVLELKQGSIYLPHYNSKQSTIVLITEGTLRFEMACPQQEQEEEEEEEQEGSPSGQYRMINTEAKPGDVFVIPADHPVIMIASSNENVRAIGFGINAEKNKRIFLAGRNNIVKNIEREAQELSFGVPVKMVEKVFGNQEESHFVSESQQRQQRGEGSRGNGLPSMIMDFSSFF